MVLPGASELKSGQWSDRVASGPQYCQTGAEAPPKSVGTPCALAAERTSLEEANREREDDRCEKCD